MNISSICTRRLVAVDGGSSLFQAAAMEEHGVRRVLVTDAEERVVGVVALDDLMDACAEEIAGLSKVIRSGLQRETSQVDGTPPMPPLPLRVPSVGTAGWNTVVG